jgi:ubiquinone/menaquinone biosynthesis C-methylase UbiE
MANAGHYVLGTIGVALLRSWLGADESSAARRVAELGRIATSSAAPPLALRFDVPELDVRTGYARWASSYDAAPNPLIRCEEVVVRAMLDRVTPGVAVDAACGTGRHTAYLAARSHRVVGVDASPEMLARARARVPAADLRTGTLERLPVDDAVADVAVCALALTHVADVAPAVAELARVVPPGGRVVVSDLHPAMFLLGGTAFFVDADGAAGSVRSFHHPFARYLAAFRAAGLDVVDCVEPVLEDEDIPAIAGGLNEFADEAFRTAWTGVPIALAWELVRRA